MGSVVLACRSCGEHLTDPLVELAELPEPEQHEDGTPTSTLGCLVIHPKDGRSLEPHPDPVRSSGCCGHDGLDGPNRLCPGCKAEAATLRDDCWSLVELRFEPHAVSVIRR